MTDIVGDIKSPEQAAAFLMERFRSYLPDREREELGRLVEEMMIEYAHWAASVAVESSSPR
jgi:hypothetical protein